MCGYWTPLKSAMMMWFALVSKLDVIQLRVKITLDCLHVNSKFILSNSGKYSLDILIA